ncbi:MAG: hypothetical protein WC528_03335 [Patescibacteria group bacterium]
MKKIALVATTVLAFALPFVAMAQTPLSIENIGGTLGLGTADLKASVINILQWILGLLGLIAVVILVIAGFMWMTAAGNEDKIDKAKKMISGAVIGIIIILLAWAIIIFVVNTTRDVTV